MAVAMAVVMAMMMVVMEMDDVDGGGQVVERLQQLLGDLLVSRMI